MAHLTSRTAYRQLVERLNRFPQGAPPSELLYRILELLFEPREAGLVAQLPIKPFTAADAARVWKMPEPDARAVLDELAGRAILVDSERDGETTWVLPPPMAGFFEFSMMRLRGDVDQRALAELYYEYINVEEEFITGLFAVGETQLGRVFVSEPALERLSPGTEGHLQVLDFERASRVAESATCIGIGLCYCRHKMQHVDRACEAPLDICMTFNGVAEALTRHGYARRVDAAECLDLLDEARAGGLVQFGENVRREVSFICNCCGCCCEAMIAARKFGHLRPVHTTNYLPRVDDAECRGCGACVNACPVEALSLVSANDPHRPKRRRARLDSGRCLGCGVCVLSCRHGNITLEPRGERVITPLDSVHRTVVMAVERGTLHHLLFDDRSRWSHRALAAVLGVILRLGPVQRALAQEQLKSRYLESLIERWQGSQGGSRSRPSPLRHSGQG